MVFFAIWWLIARRALPATASAVVLVLVSAIVAATFSEGYFWMTAIAAALIAATSEIMRVRSGSDTFG